MTLYYMIRAYPWPLSACEGETVSFYVDENNTVHYHTNYYLDYYPRPASYCMGFTESLWEK